MNQKVIIIDYGVGNVHSIAHAISYLGYPCEISRESKVIQQASALILPGVGAFGQAISNLHKFSLINILNDEVLGRRKPILGICLGMQILGHSSQESPGFKGLGWLDFEVVGLPEQGLKIPHVGWNTLKVNSKDSYFKNLEEEPHFYFDHSFYACAPHDLILGSCNYGVDLPAVVGKENILGVQFHPEKSQNNGLKLFRNFFNHYGV
jgi:glutamine amidotransferase